MSQFSEGIRFCWMRLAALAVCGLLSLGPSTTLAQMPAVRYGAPVSEDVRTLYDGGLRYIAASQQNDGSWQASYGQGPGMAGLCSLAILSRGEDPNFGAYAETLHRALRYIVLRQSRTNGFISQGGNSHTNMYEHGFATLALAEAYGAVDETLLWAGQGAARGGKKRGLGKALELAVQAAIDSQNSNPLGGWRYSPNATDADSSVSGAILVSLLAARNAGIRVPEKNIERALKYYETSTLSDGTVVYTPGMGGGYSMARSAIGALVFAIAKQKDSPSHRQPLQSLVDRLEDEPQQHPYYTRYYIAQALFHGDVASWTRWNERTTEVLLASQREDGAIGHDAYSTSMSLLALALSFRFLPIYER